jgi:hypothetical protein
MVLFWEVLETLGNGAQLKEIGLWVMSLWAIFVPRLLSVPLSASCPCDVRCFVGSHASCHDVQPQLRAIAAETS